jgi:predicted ATPase/class 3 adenylate cyclase
MGLKESPTGTVTFLFSDIEGSTRLFQQYPDAMRLALARHDALLRGAIQQNRGHVFKTMGDAFLAVFQTCRDALEASIAAQRALRAEPWQNVPPVKVRMALHTGEADERDGDYFGQPLNRCARLLSAAHGGQVLVSRATGELAHEAFPVGAGLKDLGEHRLKDLLRADRIFQLLHPDLSAEFPGLRVLDSLPNNLPSQPTSFVGRQQELADVKVLLDAGRLVTLKAMGGCGKTRLGLQVAADVLEQFPNDGVWFVELAPLINGALVVQAVATVLGVKEEPSRPLVGTLLERLRDRQLLLLLDNCEHVIEDCARLAEAMLRTSKRVKVLATSRDLLNVAGETLYHVAPLGLPADDRATAQSEAVCLFIERARAQRPFTLAEQNRADVLRICRQLDGIPLAIELAAARYRMLGVAEIAERLSKMFRILTDGGRIVLPRQKTLWASIDWSYAPLPPDEQKLFRQLSVFVGGWTLDAAEAGCGGSEVFDLLARLVDKSLVLAEEHGQETRYRFLEPVRQYAWEKANEAGEIDALQTRHLEFFRQLAERAEPHLTGAEQQTWLERLDADHDNLRAALEYSRTGTAQAAVGLRLAAALWRFWYVRGFFAEGRRNLETALERCPGTKGTLRAKALKGTGNLAGIQGDYDAARRLHQKSLVLFREVGDSLGVASALNNLGYIALEQGQHDTAATSFEEALRLVRESGGSDHTKAALLHNLGVLARDSDDYTKAKERIEESLSIRRRLSDEGGIAGCLYDSGIAAKNQGEFASAKSLLEEALTLQRALGDKRHAAWAVNYLGDVDWANGNVEPARAKYQQALESFRDIDDQRGCAFALCGLGGLAQVRRDLPEARRLYEESLKIFEAVADSGGTAWALCRVSHVACEQNDLAAAGKYLLKCLKIRQAMGIPSGLAEAFESAAVLASVKGDLLRAAKLFGTAADIREKIGVPPLPSERAHYDEHIAELRTQLGEPSFVAAWEQGRTMTTEQAVALAFGAAS